MRQQKSILNKFGFFLKKAFGYMSFKSDFTSSNVGYSLNCIEYLNSIQNFYNLIKSLFDWFRKINFSLLFNISPLEFKILIR